MAAQARTITRRTALAGIGTVSALLAARPRTLHAQAASDVDKAVAWAKANLPNSTPDIVQGAAKEGRLTLLLQTGGTDEAVTAMIQRFNTHYPFIKATYTLQATAQVLNRFSSEVNAGRGVSDAIQLPADQTEVNRYVASGALANFVISQDAAFPQGAKNAGYWYAWAVDRSVTAYRKGALTPDEIELVRTFQGLGDPRFKGRIGMNGITNSSTQTGAYALYSQPDKHLWERLAANKPHLKSASLPLINGLMAGEYDVSVFGAFASAASAAKGGAPIEFGTTALVPTVYILGGVSSIAPNPNAARLWQDWVMSKEGQDIWVEHMGVISARSDTVKSWAQQQPWFFEDPASHKPLNWADFAKAQKDVVARFQADFQTG